MKLFRWMKYKYQEFRLKQKLKNCSEQDLLEVHKHLKADLEKEGYDVSLSHNGRALSF